MPVIDFVYVELDPTVLPTPVCVILISGFSPLWSTNTRLVVFEPNAETAFALTVNTGLTGAFGLGAVTATLCANTGNAVKSISVTRVFFMLLIINRFVFSAYSPCLFG
jgi:hypothetical protein